MPIIKENDSVWVEYTIPQKYKNMIDKVFLTEFRNQLFRMHEHYYLDSFADEGIPMNTSTSGWFVAFGKTCLLYHKEELLDYWRTLSWYDSDIFDGELADMLVKSKLILDDITKYTEKYLGITDEHIVGCVKCYNLYEDKDCEELSSDDEDYDIYVEDNFTPHICVSCKDGNSIKDIRARLEEKGLLQIVSNELNINNQYLCTCNKCGHIYEIDQGVNPTDNFVCHYCNDKKTEPYKTTDYYRQTLEELDKYKKEHPINEENENS